MNLHEYQAKQLFARYGMPAPTGYACTTPREAEEAASKIGAGPWVVNYLWKNAHLVAKVVEGKEEEGAKFRDYFDHHEPIAQVPSHRALAMFRGRNEGILQLSLNADPQFDEAPRESQAEQIIISHLDLRLNNAPADAWRKAVVNWTWRIKVLLHLETELMGTVRERAEDEAINVFARNLHDLLMAAPAGMVISAYPTEPLRRRRSRSFSNSVPRRSANISSSVCGSLRRQFGYSVLVPGTFTGVAISSQSSGCRPSNALALSAT